MRVKKADGSGRRGDLGGERREVGRGGAPEDAGDDADGEQAAKQRARAVLVTGAAAARRRRRRGARVARHGQIGPEGFCSVVSEVAGAVEVRTD